MSLSTDRFPDLTDAADGCDNRKPARHPSAGNALNATGEAIRWNAGDAGRLRRKSFLLLKIKQI